MKDTLRRNDGILLCGGKGTRLRDVTHDKLPKSLYSVGGRPLIQYSIDSMPHRLVGRLIFAIEHQEEHIIQWVHRAKLPHEVVYSRQDGPGVLQAIQSGMRHSRGNEVMVGNTDEVRHGLDVEKLIRTHTLQGKLATMVACPSDNLARHRLITENEGLVTQTELKPQRFLNHPDVVGLVNTGFFLFEPKVADYFDFEHSCGWSGIIDPLCDASQLAVHIEPKMRYFNVGTPEELREAESYMTSTGSIYMGK